MPKPEVPDQRAAWQKRVDALKDVPELFRLLWDCAPPQVAGTITLRVTGGLMPLAMLYIAKQIIDLIALSAQGKPVEPQTLYYWVWAEFSIAALSHVMGRAIDYLDSIIADKFSLGLGLRIMRHSASLDLRSFEDPAFYDRLARARAQTTDRIGMLTSAGWLLQRTVMLISLSSGIIVYSPWLLVVLFLCVLPSFLVESHFAFLGYGLAHALTPARRSLDYLQTLGSSREAAKEVKVFALSPHFETRYAAVSEAVIKQNRTLARRRLMWGAIFAVFSSAGYYGSYAYIAWKALLGELSVGTFTFLVGAIAGANSHLQMIFSLFSGIADQALFLRDLVLFFHETPVIERSSGGLSPPRPMQRGIELQNVTFRYPGSSRAVLSDLNLLIRPGERIALVGENGEGKTTLVKLLVRLYDPTEGRILLDGKDLKEYSLSELRQQFGVIFQDFLRYDLSARENIAAGNIARIDDDEALWEASRKSNASELLSQFPSKLDQMLGTRFEGGVDLSGGEWQRLALARAYLRDAQLLILDEPTAALDPLAEAEVFQKFAELTKDRTALFISHRFSTVRMADRILLLAQGRISEDGSHEELLRAGGRYAQFFEIQASSYR